LKSIVVHCPTAAKPYFEQLVKLGVERVVYDPNYADDEEETDDMDIMDEEEEEEEEEEEDEEYE
jgi:ABC-type phosphate/phosphonate transport system ATPase subunit